MDQHNGPSPLEQELREALEPFARAYERWSDGGESLAGWQAQRMKLSVDAHRFRRAYEAFQGSRR